MIDPVAEHIHRVLGLPPPGEQQPKRRRDPAIGLALQIDAAADDWLRGRTASIDALERALPRATPAQVRKAFALLRRHDERSTT